MQPHSHTPYAVLMPLAPWESPQILREALKSLEWQTLPMAQVVVSCDGQPPALLSKELHESPLPLDLVIGPGDEGVGPVLARGLQQCQYNFIVRADSDDISLPQRCTIQVMHMEKSTKVIASSSVVDEFSDSPGHPVAQRSVPIGDERIWSVSRWRNPLNHPSVIFRKKEVMDVGGYRSRPGFEDYDLWLRLLRFYGRSALSNSTQTLVQARVGPAHLSRRHGYRYALREANFFIGCGFESLLPWPHVVAALAVRTPLRLLPSRILKRVMFQATRNSVK